MQKLFDIVYENADLLVINKRADLVCHPTKGDVYSSLISRVRMYLGPEANAHMINRLDRETSGIVVVAKHRQAAAELGRIWEDRVVSKQYLAIVHGWPSEDHMTISAALGKDDQSILSIKDCVRPDGSPAQTEFRVQKRFARREGTFSLLKVIPLTGRKHQIRIHLAHHGHPIVGEKVYCRDESLYLNFVQMRLTPQQRAALILPWHALHAEAARFSWRQQDFCFSAQPEQWFVEFCSYAACSSLPMPHLSKHVPQQVSMYLPSRQGCDEARGDHAIQKLFKKILTLGG